MDRKSRFIFVIKCCLGWSIIAHGQVLFNTFLFHDGVYCFNNVGTTYSSGRWMLGLLEDMTGIMGSRYSLSSFFGFITLFCIAVSFFLIVNELNINSKILLALAGGITISFPAIVSIFGYMYTAPYYYFGVLLGVFGAYLFSRKRSLLTFLICTLLMACSTAIYQSNIAVNITVLLLFMLNQVYSSEFSWKKYWITAFQNIAICIAFLGEYLAINKVVLYIKHITLNDYKGISSFGVTSLSGYLIRIVDAYKTFMGVPNSNIKSTYSGWARYVNFCIVVIGILLVLLFVVFDAKKDISKRIQMLLIIVLIPLASYFNFVMVGMSEVAERMSFSEVLLFVLLIWIVEKIPDLKSIDFAIRRTIYALLGILLFFNIKLCNCCYTKAEILQSQTISYYNTLISSIKNTEGYSDTLPVVYIKERKKNDDDFSGAGYLFDTKLPMPYSYNSLINDYAWKETMKLWCGYSPEVLDSAPYADNETVRSMPCYPDEGSIKIVDDVIVIKFAD